MKAGQRHLHHARYLEADSPAEHGGEDNRSRDGYAPETNGRCLLMRGVILVIFVENPPDPASQATLALRPCQACSGANFRTPIEGNLQPA